MPGRRAGRPWVDARREGGSGAGPRWPEQAVEGGVGHEGVVQAAGSGRPQRREVVRGSDHERSCSAYMVAEHVLRRSVRVIQVVGPVFMVMVAFFLPMQRSVFQVGQGVHRRARARHGHRLPEHGKQHDEEDGGTAH